MRSETLPTVPHGKVCVTLCLELMCHQDLWFFRGRNFKFPTKLFYDEIGFQILQACSRIVPWEVYPPTPLQAEHTNMYTVEQTQKKYAHIFQVTVQF